MNIWTSKEIAKLLLELDDRKLPFDKFSLTREGENLKLLGRGGSADVYEARIRGKEVAKEKNNVYAMKVIGFTGKHADSEFFLNAVKVQQDLGDYQDNVVKVYDYSELWVSLDEKDQVVAAVKEKPEKLTKRTIKLQFIVMEKVASVFSRTKAGNIRTIPEQLGRGDEPEVLKLAYDIGQALQRAHTHLVLHRDVKLENVFYSPEKKIYKLGDFGIAKQTDDGMASTIAFTKGYAAPEVRGTLEHDRYDHTADIYSFGIMLYVLMNGMKFPDSNSYNVNPSMQYSKGYIVPQPEHASWEFYEIIAKMCMYDPEDRYQSMEEVMADIERLMYDNSTSYKKRHEKEPVVVGGLFLMLGALFWVLTMNRWDNGLQEYRWISVAFLSLAVVLYYQYFFISNFKRREVSMVFKRNLYWFVIGAMYLMIFIMGCLGNKNPINPFYDYSQLSAVRKWLYFDYALWLYRHSELLRMVGVTGMLFCIFWSLRERAAIRREKRKYEQ